MFEPITRVKAWYVLSEGVVFGLWIGRGVVWPSAKIHVEDVSDCREMRTAVWGGGTDFALKWIVDQFVFGDAFEPSPLLSL